MSDSTTTKVRCRQATLCNREHFECDCCGRMVHDVRSYGEDGPSACHLCSTQHRGGWSRWDAHVDKLWAARREAQAVRSRLALDNERV